MRLVTSLVTNMLIVVLLALAGAAIAYGGTPEAASVFVRVDGAAGSGVVVGPDLIATNGHVIGWRMDTAATVTAHVDGRTYRATVVALDPDADVALLHARGARLDPVTLADTPPEGAEVHLLGYGRRGVLARGAGRILRRVFSYRTPRGQVPVILCHLASEPGDSGGGIFDADGRMVALNWGAITATGQSLSTPSVYVAKLMAGYRETAGCGGGVGSCDLGSQLPTAGSGWGPPPPKFPVQRPPSSPDASAPPRPSQQLNIPPALAPVAPSASSEAIAAAILDRIASDPRFRGPAGPQGLPGPAGPKGEYGPQGRDAPPVDLEVLADAVAARLAARTTPPVTSGPTIHYVLVGDERTAGWDRVQAAYRTASASFRGIRTEPPPPAFVGRLPVLIRYTNSIPEYVARGSYEVEQALGRMARGQAL